MLSGLWSFMIIFSVVVSVFTGRLEETVNGAMNGAGAGVNMCISMLGVICAWNGIMKIADKSGIIEKVTFLIKPIFRLLFKGVSPSSEAGKSIIMNLTANLMGMGNAATPAGLQAMKELNRLENKEKNKHMLMFTVLNTASFQLIPSTIIALRSAAGSQNAAKIIIPIWCASFVSVAMVIFCGKMVGGK